MRSIFISYSHEDKIAAERIHQVLEDNAFQVWRDEQRIESHGHLPDQVEAAADSALFVVVLWSQHSRKSDWVLGEADIGLKADKLIQVRLDREDPPIQFRSRPWIELQGYPTDGEHMGLTELLRSLGRSVPRVSATLSANLEPKLGKRLWASIFALGLLMTGILIAIVWLASQRPDPLPDKSGAGVPPGTVVAFAGKVENIPSGWLLCDGRPFDINHVYQHASGQYDDPDGVNPNTAPFKGLRKRIGEQWGASDDGSSPDQGKAQLPDLRGLFLRGVDGAAGNDPDAATGRYERFENGEPINQLPDGDRVGSVQGDSLKGHQHLYVHAYGTDIGSVADGGGAGRMQSTTGEPSNEETRPKNAYVNWIIKY